MKLDLKILSTLLLLWATANIVDAITQNNPVNLFKGCVTLLICVYLWIGSTNLVITYQKKR